MSQLLIIFPLSEFIVPDPVRVNPFDANGKKKTARKTQKRVFAKSKSSRIAFDRYFEPRGDVETSALGLKVRGHVGSD